VTSPSPGAPMTRPAGMVAAPRSRLHPQAGFSRGPGGQCRYCGATLRHRRNWCGSACVHNWRMRSDPGYARRAVLARDRGVCCACGLDTVALMSFLRQPLGTLDEYRRVATIAWLLGYWRSRGSVVCEVVHLRQSPLWQADHIVPVVDGGSDLGLANLRTLCTPCHRAETAALRRALAFRRRAARWLAEVKS
jgi:5-methylcytosine-specific restriction protein A